MNKDSETVEKVTGEVIGAEFTSLERESYGTLCEEIKSEVGKIDTAYLAIAIKLHTIYQRKLYQIDNFPNIYEMAYEKFMLGRATCNNYINLCEKFGRFDETTKACTGLLPQYEKFSSSKLVAMLNMPDELRKEITPDMSVREIRRRKQIYNDRLGVSDHSKQDSNDNTAKPSKSSVKKQKFELIKTVNIDDIFNSEKSSLIERVQEFETEHPDTKYNITVTLVCEE